MTLCAIAGCTGSVSSAGANVDAEAATTTTAVVIVARNTNGDDGATAEASARFVRTAASASSREALRVIGAAGDMPRRGTCVPIASLSTSGDAAPSGESAPVIELLDVGGVSVEASGIETRLPPRQLPDVTDVVSGVVYARALDASALPAQASYKVRVLGRGEFAAFEAAATAPLDPSGIRIAGEDVAAARVVVGDNSAVDVLWAGDGTADLVYVDVQPAGVRCVLGDWRGESDGPLHAALAASLFDESGTVSLHRLHIEPLRAPGLDQGEIRFDFARSLAYTRH